MVEDEVHITVTVQLELDEVDEVGMLLYLEVEATVQIIHEVDEVEVHRIVEEMQWELVEQVEAV